MFLFETSTEAPANELVIEKITRPNNSGLLSRDRLLSLMSQSLTACSATVLIGRAGSGKTSLGADFASKCRRPTAWYKVDAPETDIRVFFQYLIGSLSRAVKGFGSRELIQIASEAIEDQASRLADALVYELAERQARPLLIVVEDLHLICDASWVLRFFQRLLPLLPSHVHIVITSRTMPPAPLWRMRSKQSLFVIKEEALAFTRVEANELFVSLGLSCEEATIAVDHTNGRAAALVSFAESLRKQKNGGRPGSQSVSLAAT
jgi:LuxR family maltose regulon positive regulatory protein